MEKLKFFVDECVGILIAKWLIENGYDAISVITEMRGSKDITILNKALSENRIVITSDKDFGDLAFHKKAQHAGIILIRLQNGIPKNKIKALANLLAKYSDQLANNFIVVSETNVRVVKPTFH